MTIEGLQAYIFPNLCSGSSMLDFFSDLLRMDNSYSALNAMSVNAACEFVAHW